MSLHIYLIAAYRRTLSPCESLQVPPDQHRINKRARAEDQYITIKAVASQQVQRSRIYIHPNTDISLTDLDDHAPGSGLEISSLITNNIQTYR